MTKRTAPLNSGTASFLHASILIFFFGGVGWCFFCLIWFFGDCKSRVNSDLHRFVPFQGYTLM